MLRRYAKAAVFAVVLVVLVVEGFFVYRWYDHYYYDQDAAVSDAAGGAAEATTVEGTGSGVARGAGGADSSGGNDAGGSADEAAFAHVATDANSRGDYTYLGDPSIDGDPNAAVLAAPTGSYAHNIGVWFEPGARRWAIFNQDRVAVPDGANFEVVIPPEPDVFVHRAGLIDIVGNSTYVDDPLVNGAPDAEVSVTQNWNPGGGGGVYNNHPVGVFYDEDVNEWAVYNTDGAQMPEGAAFNVSVSGGD